MSSASEAPRRSSGRRAGRIPTWADRLRLAGRRGRRGVAAAEFAVVAGILVLLLFGTADLLLFMRAQVKLDSAAVQVGHVLSRCDRITTSGDTDDIWRVASTALGGTAEVNAGSATTVVISGVTNVRNVNTVAWQVKSKASATSAIGAVGRAATIPGGYVVPTAQVMIVTEINSPARLWVLSTLLLNTRALPTEIFSTTMYLSRVGDAAPVATPPANSTAKACMA